MTIPENGSVQRPFSQDIPSVQPANAGPPAKESDILSILQSVNQPEVANKERVISVKSPVDEALLAELLQVLNLQATEIEKELELLEKTKQVLEFVEAYGELQGGLKGAVEVFDATNEKIKSGVEFLEHLLPEVILAKLPSEIQHKNVSRLTTLAGAFLAALEAGFAEAALIYKMKIIEQSKEIIKLMKQTPDQGMPQRPSETKISKLELSLAEWEMNIRMEQEKLAETTIQTRISTASFLVYLASLPLNYIPETSSFAKYATLVSSGVMGLMSFLDVISLGLQLKKATKETQQFIDWQDAYLEWKEEHVVRVSGDLLEKRHKILKEKIAKLKPRFQEIKGKIQAQKENAFRKEMDQLFKMQINQPNLNLASLREALEKWGFSATEEGRKVHFALARLMTNPKDPLLKQKLVEAFQQWMNHPTAMRQQFQCWFTQQIGNNKKLEALLASYVDQQETIEITTKNALKEMVQKKHEIEESFINLKLFGSLANFSLAALTLTISSTLFILGILTLPLGGAGIILMALGTGTAVFGYGLMGASLALAYRERPNLTQFLIQKFFELRYVKLRKGISSYFHQSNEAKLKEIKNKHKEKENRMLEMAQKLFDLHIGFQGDNRSDSDIHKALEAYHKAKREFDESKAVDASKTYEQSAEFVESKEKVKGWSDRLERLEKTMQEKGWEDFAQNASLQVDEKQEAFGSLRAFKEAFKTCDVNLLSDETKDLLKVHLGIDLAALQAQLENNPEAIQNALQKFFAMNEDDVVAFITKQSARLDAKVLHTQMA